MIGMIARTVVAVVAAELTLRAMRFGYEKVRLARK